MISTYVCGCARRGKKRAHGVAIMQTPGLPLGQTGAEDHYDAIVIPGPTSTGILFSVSSRGRHELGISVDASATFLRRTGDPSACRMAPASEDIWRLLG